MKRQGEYRVGGRVVYSQRRGSKYWRVSHVGEKLVLINRNGEARIILKDDRYLRRAYFWEKWLYKERYNFPVG